VAERPTIYDVARLAGVTPSTVSRALARPGRVSAATAERIRLVATELGYRATPQARAQTTTRTKMIAFVIADITNPFAFELIRGAEHAAASAGYITVISDTQESVAGERLRIDRILPSVDGVVLATSRMSDSAIRMTAKQRPTVVLNRKIVDVPSVVTDNPRGMRRAAEHLRELGHRTITYLPGPEASWADGMRWRALLEASHELDLKARRIGPCRPTVDAGVEASQAVADSGTTAVIAYNDLLAIGLIRGLQRLGVRVPDDVSVIGFDDILISRLVTPELTTVAAPLRKMGETAVQNLIGYIGGATSRTEAPVVLPTRLVVRASTTRYRSPRSRVRPPLS
jgi:LacI family repressor for deo operon, udp, cdd, tsx, nupC, and nupG